MIQDLVTALLSSKSTIRAVAVEQFGISGELSEEVITTTQEEKKAGMDSSSFEPARILRILHCWFQNKGGEIKLDIFMEKVKLLFWLKLE